MSKSDYFKKSSAELKQGREDMIVFLHIKNFDPDQIGWFCKAYDYFIENPKEYNGASYSQDLYCISTLELWSMLHDWFYIALNVWADRYYMRQSDKILRLTMHKGNDAGFEMNWRTVRLFFLRGLYPWYNRAFKGRVMTDQNKKDMRLAIHTFKRLRK